jgi:hypothetical protein
MGGSPDTGEKKFATGNFLQLRGSFGFEVGLARLVWEAQRGT